jgi:hypothetical protein
MHTPAVSDGVQSIRCMQLLLLIRVSTWDFKQYGSMSGLQMIIGCSERVKSILIAPYKELTMGRVHVCCCGQSGVCNKLLSVC